MIVGITRKYRKQIIKFWQAMVAKPGPVRQLVVAQIENFVVRCLKGLGEVGKEKREIRKWLDSDCFITKTTITMQHT